MADPRRNDIFEDASGVKVAVKQLYPPNALGVSFVEYKNLSDSNLRFLPKEQFLQSFRWVDNFGSIDTFMRAVLEPGAKALEEIEGCKVPEGSDSPVETIETPDDPTDSGIRAATTTRSF